MQKRIALISMTVLLCMMAIARGQTTQPATAAGQPLQPQPLPPMPGATTDNAPRGPQSDLPLPGYIHEGTHINKRSGQVLHGADPQQLIFAFDPADGGFPYPPMILLPNLKLMLLEGAVTPRNNDFPVSGTVTEYKGKNYLMLDNVPHGTIPEQPVVNVVREGTHITNRAARLSHNANGQPILTFDTDGKTVQDPPMIIVPNLKLQTMEGNVIALTKDAHFRVSGQVTEYKGKNYILLDKAVTIIDVDQQM